MARFRTARGFCRLFAWISRPHWANLTGYQSESRGPVDPQPAMRLIRVFATLVLLASFAAPPAWSAQGFKFSNPDAVDEAEKAEKEARDAQVYEQLSTPCRQKIKDKKIMVVIGERQSNGVIYALQQNYGQHFDSINRRLRYVGLRTYTSEEIRRQIAQAEIDAYFRNDPDAALSASKRLGASFVLRGLISTQARERRPRGCRCAGEHRFIRGREHFADGADACERESRRGRRQALLGLLP